MIKKNAAAWRKTFKNAPFPPGLRRQARGSCPAGFSVSLQQVARMGNEKKEKGRAADGQARCPIKKRSD
jgi:hypothetical protein